jgi:hypothetical protein
MSVGLRKSQRALRAIVCGALALAWLGHGPLIAQQAAPGRTYESLFSTALVRLNEGRPYAAQWWLRRAFQHAKTEAERAALREAFQYASNASPLTLRFGFNVARSNNINGGSTQEYFTLEGLPFLFPISPERRPLSGTEVSGHVDLTYRLASGPRHLTSLNLYLYGRTYRLSSESQATVPYLSGSDFAYVSGELTLRHQWLLQDGLGPTSVAVSLGAVEDGRLPLYRFRKVAARQDFLLPRGQLAIGVSLEDQESQSRIRRADATVVELSTAVALQAAQGGIWRFTLQARETRSFLKTETYKEAYATAGFTPNWRVVGAVPTLTLGLGAKDFDVFILSLDGRDDRIASLSLSLELDRVSVMGFSPVFNLTGSRTRSNIAQYDVADFEASFGLESQF